MRKLALVTILGLSASCAHHGRDQNLATRQSVTAPRGDFEGARRDPGGAPAMQPETPIVTPPVP
ncbi:MAG: hypothetical protein JWN44_4859 [Myxococcales bacterium]|nr:hypothetical protein [Myxococcales bacterium]